MENIISGLKEFFYIYHSSSFQQLLIGFMHIKVWLIFSYLWETWWFDSSICGTTSMHILYHNFMSGMKGNISSLVY